MLDFCVSRIPSRSAKDEYRRFALRVPGMPSACSVPTLQAPSTSVHPGLHPITTDPLGKVIRKTPASSRCLEKFSEAGITCRSGDFNRESLGIFRNSRHLRWPTYKIQRAGLDMTRRQSTTTCVRKGDGVLACESNGT